jgi:hypothetical protein
LQHGIQEYLMRLRSLLVITAAILVSFGVLAAARPVEAHRDGCHRHHSCPSDTGSYVCGDLGNDSECPNSAPQPTPKPKLQPTAEPAATPKPAAKPKPAATPKPQAAPKSDSVTTVTIQHGGNVRKTARVVATNILGQACPGDQAIVQQKAAPWYKIRISKIVDSCDASRVQVGTEGWIHAALLKK